MNRRSTESKDSKTTPSLRTFGQFREKQNPLEAPSPAAAIAQAALGPIPAAPAIHDALLGRVALYFSYSPIQSELDTLVTDTMNANVSLYFDYASEFIASPTFDTLSPSFSLTFTYV